MSKHKSSSEPITMYTTTWCGDCRRVKSFLTQRGIHFREVNIELDAVAEAIVLKANKGKRKVPTLKVGERYVACSPFNPAELAHELNVPLNP
ncbi:MAG TPA: glutaredoxin family protein [Candidatus Eisenbacteria bacterium]|jgi:mycoredoxin|nr:glutaredoxin family protein [Candidatus Eisenbacteria bacterium]